MKVNKRITSFDDHLDEQYGKIGTESRNEFQEEFETFKIGVLIQEARKKTTINATTTCRKNWND